ncbi:hypothetical protein [Brevibacillus nitrificans]|uniref:hypothetical protein n=1 Tax=Brevibacillus nitrificans TaxID=651560 RepID=UPI00261EF3EE|nr:hypothetical protein [Brevibacillus nitrificans]
MLTFANFCFICGNFREDSSLKCNKCETPYIRYEGTQGDALTVYYAKTTYNDEEITNLTAHQCPLCMEFVKRDGSCSCDAALSKMAQAKIVENAISQSKSEIQALRESEEYTFKSRENKYHEEKERHKANVYSYVKSNICPACGLVIRETFGGFLRCGCNDR